MTMGSNVKQQQYDIVVIGAGISGATLAERYASIGKKVLVLERRNHIGGNCYDYYNEDGILCSKYGAHLFHTNHEDVWEYVNRFSEWFPYEHRVLARVDGHLVPVPVNITTVNKLFGLELQSEEEMQAWLAENQCPCENPQNGEEAAMARVGKVLYEKIFKCYTKKQWDKFPEELDAAVLQRIPVRTNFDDRYFSDKHQAQPVEGFTAIFERMLSHPNITVRVNTDYFDVRDQLGEYEKLFYTGPIDRFFEFKYSLDEKLEYRSINFVLETHDVEYYQENSVINYPSLEDGDFTRIVEYKHMTKQKHAKTTISYEYTVDITDPATQEPYYPVLNPRNREIYEKYKAAAEQLTDVYFVGRLANYKYFNMDEAFKNALDLFNQLEGSVDTTQETTAAKTIVAIPREVEVRKAS
jgi:UDP-galactopyranose mutase